ncbi:MAG: hypothetical protein CVV27_10285 [Candidatus Melainabacteria bacterium HGW-Melainabacteria-1]|nr:MAG: hypothetical protein CVV27_10285 [Candidatus Melainabacteria bacterium HGW-Melainabacteria-1]
MRDINFKALRRLANRNLVLKRGGISDGSFNNLGGTTSGSSWMEKKEIWFCFSLNDFGLAAGFDNLNSLLARFVIGSI